MTWHLFFHWASPACGILAGVASIFEPPPSRIGRATLFVIVVISAFSLGQRI